MNGPTGPVVYPAMAPATLGCATAAETETNLLGPDVRLCIDARMLGSDGTGVARYARTLVDALSEAGVKPLLLHADMDGASRIRRWLSSTRWRARKAEHRDACLVSSADRSIAAHDVFREAQIHFNVYNRLLPVSCDGPPGVMHWTYPVPVYMRGWRNIYTIHDVIPLSEHALTPIRSKRHRRLLQRVASQADLLVTVSEIARTEIIRTLGCDPAFVVNTSQAVSVESQADPIAEIGGARDYFLFCGSIEPRKNLARLAEAYDRSGARRPLVIVGPDGWRAESIHKMLGHAQIVVLPFQSRDRLVALMKHARGLLFPSLSEGFGLPVIEAMALGTPVMTSSFGATAEVSGGAALLIDPYDIDAMAGAIGRLDEDDALCDSLGAAGLVRSLEFHTLPYAQRLISLYSTVAAGPGR